MRRIVVLGGGFAGLHAAQKLERMLEGRRRVQLTVVDGADSFVFTPLLPNVANGELTTSSIRLRLREQLRPKTRLEHAWVEGIDMARRELTSDAGSIPFDYLVLAPGAVTDWKGNASWAPHAMTCKTAADAHTIRAHMRRKVAQAKGRTGEEQRRALTFVFAGGGPTGVELAAELWAALSYEVLPAASPEVRRALRFVIVEPAPVVLPGLPPELQVFARRRLDDLGIE
ncbi:MAG: FAD-dependent oxidoreductase, partial [Myxococcota bacterium]